MWTQVTDVVVAQGGQFTTSGFSEWIKSNVIHVLILIAAAMMLWRGKSGDNPGVMKIVPGILVGLGFAGLAITNSWEPAARFLAGMFGGG